MGNPQKGRTIPMWFQTLQSMFVKKHFHYLCWSRHVFKQKTTTVINFCWPTWRNICHWMIFNYLPQFLYKDTEQNNIFRAAVFCWELAASLHLPFLFLVSFMDCIHDNRLIRFTWQLSANNFMLKSVKFSTQVKFNFFRTVSWHQNILIYEVNFNLKLSWNNNTSNQWFLLI